MLFHWMHRALAFTRLANWSWLVPQINQFEPELESLDDSQLRKNSLSLRYRAHANEPLEKLLPEAFALVREAAHRALGMRHYDVQLLGGVAMHFGAVAEMQTGEGKTLTATLPMYLAALSGKGAHLATANDYLARRDADWMRPAYELLGLSVGVVESSTPRGQRRQAYQCDVTYGTAKEFGFDFLRDRLIDRRAADGGGRLLAEMLGHTDGPPPDEPVQRALHFALIDEADSILIDEARTPLIVSSLPGESERAAAALYRWAASVQHRFNEHDHYEYKHAQRTVTLNAAGRRLLRELSKPEALVEVGMLDLYEHVERAIKVKREFLPDRHYVVREGEIVIVDEFTGRLAEGRKWRVGIHQAVEAQEGVEISIESGDAARIAIQDLFLRYSRLAGMTGTAANSGPELQRIYKVFVAAVPTNRPPRREGLPDLVFGTAEHKWRAIVEEAAEIHATGRPVLVGTRSIDKSERLSRMLTEAGLIHQVLNARHSAAEAELVASAGQAGKITVATNMAGRGTDIKLGPGVVELGGLHVICTELHESQRIDRQLIGRCGRQGDPGTYRQFLALDDDILRAGFGPRRADRYRDQGLRSQGPFHHLASLFRQAQARVEREHFRQRKLLLHFEHDRRKLQEQMGQDPYLDGPS